MLTALLLHSAVHLTGWAVPRCYQTGCTEIVSEREVRKRSSDSIDSNSQPDYREKLNAELKALRESEMWQTAVTVRKLRPENN